MLEVVTAATLFAVQVNKTRLKLCGTLTIYQLAFWSHVSIITSHSFQNSRRIAVLKIVDHEQKLGCSLTLILLCSRQADDSNHRRHSQDPLPMNHNCTSFKKEPLLTLANCPTAGKAKRDEWFVHIKILFYLELLIKKRNSMDGFPLMWVTICLVIGIRAALATFVLL